MTKPHQDPAPGTRVLRYRGDLAVFSLSLAAAAPGRAGLRTNIGYASRRRREIVEHVERDRPLLDQDWHDWPMQPDGPGRFTLSLPLLEVGRFEAKAYFLPEGRAEPLWPAGENVVIKVEPAAYCCGASIYTAFVRQFAFDHARWPPASEESEATAALERAGYTVIPHSGTFRDLARELDFIVGEMGFRIVQLLPVFPTPTTYARMGRFGSPFAALDFRDVDPALAEFDRRTTPLDQFRELADAVHLRAGRLFLDMPVNHTGWASWLQTHRPQWFVRNPDLTFRSPGAWGVTWEDLAQLDYAHRDLWRYMAETFLFWCSRGVDGFRCDAGYMVPLDAWRYMVARVRDEYPDTVFLLEGLGGKAETVNALLDEGNLDWAYSELFQNYDRAQIEAYLPGCLAASERTGLLVHFAETHDNDRLAARSQAYASLRTALAALLSRDGGFGISNGVEWFARQKIDVHGASALNWGAAQNQVPLIARLNRLLAEHPCFHAGAALRLLPCGDAPVVGLLRTRPESGAAVLALANLDEDAAAEAVWPADEFDPGAEGRDLVAACALTVARRGPYCVLPLPPAGFVCLAARDEDARAQRESGTGEPSRCLAQRRRAVALELLARYRKPGRVAEEDIATAIRDLRTDPRACVAQLAGTGHAPVTRWQWPRDLHRNVPVPAGHLLLVSAPHPFTVDLRDTGRLLARRESLPLEDGTHAALPLDRRRPGGRGERRIELAVRTPEGLRRGCAAVLYLPRGDGREPPASLRAGELARGDACALLTNGRGAMAQVRGAWGRVRSQYDAMLAANLHPEVPVDRHVLLVRCRAWLVRLGFSQAVNFECQTSFAARDNAAQWRFAVPVGLGRQVDLAVSLRFAPQRNAVTLSFSRAPAVRPGHLPDNDPVRLIVRPDLDDRNAHHKTKAYQGPEQMWPRAVRPQARGFLFQPASDRRLRMHAEPGSFTPEPEWTYMVRHAEERERGLEDSSDVFSPGYFTLLLHGGEGALLTADAEPEPTPPAAVSTDAAAELPSSLGETMQRAMDAFVVRRGERKTVIAGYPWFLDWGRDTLICLRGLIAAGRLAEAGQIIRQFAALERQGTLPNMLRGEDDSNRSTSDAPLWLLTACRDWRRAAADESLFDWDCGGRPLREVLLSIGRAYRAGTPNGVRADESSGLVFSPTHFTWMDTNHPAATPRQGYPIEIQALWFAGLELLAQLEPHGCWSSLAERVRDNTGRLYRREAGAGLVDCLHTQGGPADGAAPDDAVRPNQLLALTLGLVDDVALCDSVLACTEELLVPGAIRSLADRPVSTPLPVRRDGRLLNDPGRPYWGRYEGDEDTRRKPAYHNGTAWTWLFPSYSEALYLTHGPAVRAAALSLLAGSRRLIREGCLGQVPEIVDGDAPHRQRGCGAQAWGATELFRVWTLLTKEH